MHKLGEKNTILDENTFTTVVQNTPLVSIDLCLVFNKKILLGKRRNNPLKGFWFTPGGVIRKNENWQNALLRVANCELGLKDLRVEDFVLMGVWDHMYSNSAFDENVSTHYVNLPHYKNLKSKPEIILDDQHIEIGWFSLLKVSKDKKFHLYMRNYANLILNNSELFGG